jgi:hypothetical protein
MPDTRPQKITCGQMRESGVRGVLVYCADYRCSHSLAISNDAWPDDVRIETRFVCGACGKRGAVRLRVGDRSLRWPKRPSRSGKFRFSSLTGPTSELAAYHA